MNTPTNTTQIPFNEDARIAVLTKNFLTALNGAGGDPIETMTPADARLVLVGAQASVNVDLSGIDESEKDIVADGYNIKLNVVKPAGSEGILPVFIFLHGGGWVLGDYPTHKRLVRDLVVASGAAAVFVNYTPSPEAQYPQAINEIFAATQWVANHGEELGVDGKNMAIVGNSVGGNMSAVTALKAKLNHGPHLKLQVLLWPLINADFGTESYQEFGQERFLTTPLMKWMFDLYASNLDEREEIFISPINATLEQLQGLPPALIQIAENDILRDAAIAYGRKLDEAGVPTTSIVYNGAIHDFGMLNAMAEIPQTKSMILHAAAELKKYLF